MLEDNNNLKIYVYLYRLNFCNDPLQNSNEVIICCNDIQIYCFHYYFLKEKVLPPPPDNIIQNLYVTEKENSFDRVKRYGHNLLSNSLLSSSFKIIIYTLSIKLHCYSHPFLYFYGLPFNYKREKILLL